MAIIETTIAQLDDILEGWQNVIREDYEGYRNHVARMLNFCFYLRPPSRQEREKLILAGAFHDIGIWTAGTVDYLAPSIVTAKTYLATKGLADWSDEISTIIDLHHKLRPVQNALSPLVEIFRRGDLVDFSLGLIRFGVPSAYVSAVRAALPNAGFHKRLFQLTWGQVKRHPLDPAPMIRW